MPPSRQFASDTTCGVHPEVVAALSAAAGGHVGSYSDDPYTERAVAALRRHFGPRADVYFVFNGTAANVTALKALLRSHQAVLCDAGSHVFYDETGAAEAIIGCKLIPVASPDGKLTPKLLEPHLERIGDQHAVQPYVVSLSQATEQGTVYTPAEIRSLTDFAHGKGLLVHMDGARLANAAAFLDVPLAALTAEVGVDVVSFGGTKNGLMGADAVIFLEPALGRDFKYVRKQGLQLASKMRFLSAQFEALMSGDLWLRNARQANAMARLLARLVREIPGITLAREPEANGVFVRMAADRAERLRETHSFATWDPALGEVRWMCGYDATEADVRAFADAVRRVMETR
jgi:threonine aldolase